MKRILLILFHCILLSGTSIFAQSLPVIESVSPDSAPLAGNVTVTVTGRNFTEDTRVVLGDGAATTKVESPSRLTFIVPPQISPGSRTLTIQNAAGIAQRSFFIASARLSELSTGQIATYAGGLVDTGDGGQAIAAALDFVNGEGLGAGNITVDRAGNLYIADTHNHRIRRVDAVTRVITTIAGTSRAGFSGDGESALLATLSEPRGIAIDSAGNIFIADAGNNRIRRIDAATGIISTYAGSGNQGLAGDGQDALEAAFALITGLAVDTTGNLYIADTGNSRIRRVDAASRIITTIAGKGEAYSSGGFAGDGGAATDALISLPFAIAIDSSGNIFFSDTGNNRIRRIDTAGRITTVAGDGFKNASGEGRFAGDGGLATAASLFAPTGVAFDAQGNLYIGDTLNLRVRRVGLDGIITTVAGNGSFGLSGDGGLATAASFIAPNHLAVDTSGKHYLIDSGNGRVRVVENGVITTFAGRGDFRFSGDGGAANRAAFNFPRQLAIDGAGNLFIADQLNFRIRRVDTAQIVTTVAGNGTYCCDGRDGGAATSQSLANGVGVAVTRSGDTFYIAAREESVVYRVTNNVITRFAGGGNPSSGIGDGGQARNARLSSPVALALDRAGNVYISENGGNRVRRVDTTGIITTVAGNGTAGYTGDGGLATAAQLAGSNGIALDNSGNLYIADTDNFCIRRVSATGTITTFAGRGNRVEDNIPATQARIGSPTSVATDAAGNVFISIYDHEIRRVDATTNLITTVAGNALAGYAGDNSAASSSQLAFPFGLILDGRGNLYISDSGNNSVRVVKGVGVAEPQVSEVRYTKPTLTITGSGFGTSSAQVNVNGTDITPAKTSQSDTSITLKGNKKKLALKKGANQIVVTVNGALSNTFTFNF